MRYKPSPATRLSRRFTFSGRESSRPKPNSKMKRNPRRNPVPANSLAMDRENAPAPHSFKSHRRRRTVARRRTGRTSDLAPLMSWTTEKEVDLVTPLPPVSKPHAIAINLRRRKWQQRTESRTRTSGFEKLVCPNMNFNYRPLARGNLARKPSSHR